MKLVLTQRELEQQEHGTEAFFASTRRKKRRNEALLHKNNEQKRSVDCDNRVNIIQISGLTPNFMEAES